MARHDSNTIIKFADDTTVVGLITDNDETVYREEVRDLAGWCQKNNPSLNVTKTKEMIVDYRKKQDLYTRRCQRKAPKIVKDPSHTSHRLFSLPLHGKRSLHGKRYRSAKSRTKRLLNSFYPQAIRLLNR